MKRDQDMARLLELAKMAFDHSLGRLRSSKARLDQSRMQLDAINQSGQAVDLEPIMATRVGLGYERWADMRRAELNTVIARQTAEWLEARDAAQMAFGRVQALQALSGRRTSG